jgi:hypothetical protein
MIIIKITQVAMHPKPNGQWCMKVLFIDQDPVLNYIQTSSFSLGKML